jgi:hypothetical protein
MQVLKARLDRQTPITIEWGNTIGRSMKLTAQFRADLTRGRFVAFFNV